MKKRIILFLLITILIIPCSSFNTCAASSIPVITYPSQYMEVPVRSTVTLRWSAPSTGTVSKYKISVLELNDESGNTTNRLIIDARETTATSLDLTYGKTRYNRAYRASVCAVMNDGSERWSEIRYFYGQVHKGIPTTKTLSFKIFTGFQADTKEAIYYSAQQYAHFFTSRSKELINTYPYSNGIDVPLHSEDNVNAIVPDIIEGENAPLMYCTTYWTSTNYVYEADIVVNKYFPWGNGTASNYDIQNVMTHEMGHAAGISDKYQNFASEWTMYGSSLKGEFKKRTLHSQDQQALRGLYGIT